MSLQPSSSLDIDSDACPRYVQLKSKIESSIETTFNSMEYTMSNMFNLFQNWFRNSISTTCLNWVRLTLMWDLLHMNNVLWVILSHLPFSALEYLLTILCVTSRKGKTLLHLCLHLHLIVWPSRIPPFFISHRRVRRKCRLWDLLLFNEPDMHVN